MSEPARLAFTLGYRPALDGLRGVAILLVLVHHLRLPFPTGGFLGVDLFFVLSGFLITSLLYEEWTRFGSLRFGLFYQRRALRLLPALGLVLLAVMGLALLQGPRSRVLELGRCCLAALFYSTNWLTAFQLIPWNPLSHTWSLSSEEQFYLAWPLILWGLCKAKVGRQKMLLVVAGIILLLTGYRAWQWHLHHSSVRVYYSLDTHADGLITGCFLALLLSTGALSDPSRMGGWGWPALLAIFAIACFATTDSSLVWYGGLTAVNLSAAVVMVSVLGAPQGSLGRVLRWPPLVGLGRISYGLYLWHYPIFLQVEKVLGRRGRPVSILASLAATFVVSSTSYYFVERPLLRLKRRRSEPGESPRSAEERPP